MRFGQHFPARLYAAVSILLLSIFVARTAPNFWRDLARAKIVQPSSNASMDRFLEALLRVTQPTARLNAAFAQLPAASTILFVSPKGDDRWDFVYSAVCYLSWPRKIDRVEVEPGQKFAADIADDHAVIFCGTPPTSTPRPAMSIGPNLVMLRPVP